MKPLPHPHRSVSRLFVPCILSILFTLLLVANHPSLAQSVRVIFLHHSCGENLIEQGNVREGLTALGYEFYDHGYNDEGLRLADGSYTGTNFDVPGDNTDPDGFAAIFAQPLHDPPDNTFSYLMQYDIIAFKSCFPVSNIGSDGQLAEYQSYYRSIRDRAGQYPDKVFIIVTQPPQVPFNSDPTEAARARAFANWLQSDEYLAGHPNVFVFDFFGLLAGDDDFLRPEYRADEYDAHPNEQANRTIGPLFVAFVDQAVRSAHTGAPRPTPATTPPVEQTTQPPLPVAPPPMAGLIDDFESTADHWEASTDGTGSTVECSPDTGSAHSGAASLRVHYSMAPDGWGDCGRYFESPQDWNGSAGLSLWLHSDQAGQWVTLMLLAGDPAGPTPFETYFETTAESTEGWSQFVFPWADFVRAEWADEGGLAELDPARVTGFGFSLGAGETRNEGTLWVDDIGLVTGEAQPPAEGTPPATPIEEEPSGGLCPFSALALPLGAVGILFYRRHRSPILPSASAAA
ncbi:MAG: CIA30 family protein [Anaerolineae bacterium]|nr:CIA30 family protein [Anaerolineae bacterium]